MTDDLITSLRALAAGRHDDVSIAVDAVIEIERLRSDLDTAIRERDEARAEVERVRAENEQLIAELNTIKAGFEVAYRMTGGKP